MESSNGIRLHKCDKSFPKEHGLNVHIRRKHTAAGKRWGTGKSQGITARPSLITARPGSLSIRAKVRNILENHPGGLHAASIFAKLRGSSGSKDYIAQICRSEEGVECISPGTYRLLQNSPTLEVDIPEAEPHAPAPTAQSLLVRIEHLETERDALRELVVATNAAHLTFVREVGA